MLPPFLRSAWGVAKPATELPHFARRVRRDAKAVAALPHSKART